MELESEFDPLKSRWSRLEKLSDAEAQDVWEWFARSYEPFVRRMLTLAGCSDSKSATDEFWSYVFTRRERLLNADRRRRFRSFLTGFIRNFARERRRDNAERGASGEVRFPGAEHPPEAVAMRVWAETVLHRCLDEL